MSLALLAASTRFRAGTLLFFLGSFLTAGFPDNATAHKELLTAEEKELLHKAEHIHIEALALSSHGPVDATGVTAAVAARLQRPAIIHEGLWLYFGSEERRALAAGIARLLEALERRHGHEDGRREPPEGRPVRADPVRRERAQQQDDRHERDGG